MNEAIDAGLRNVLAVAELAISELGLTRCPFPEALGALVGTHAGEPLRMHTRRWRGPGFVALTMATITDAAGQLRSVTIIGLPAAGCPGPIVGVDLIGLGGALSLVAVDLAPTDDVTWQTHAAAPLAALHTAVETHVVIRRRPSFADEVFSPRALIAGVRRGAELAVLDAVASFIEHAVGPRASPGKVAAERATAADDRVAAWCRAELRNRREHDALTRLFGAVPATAYLDMLFGAGARTAA
ncbi:MAG TPA: hypothetical protein VGB85_14485 [Nannocystis sp.]|jgi:hypothetical protein